MEILESLLEGLRTVCAGFTDARRSSTADVDYSMADIGLSAFSLLFMQGESFLSDQRRLEQGHGTSNCHTLFGMRKIPTDISAIGEWKRRDLSFAKRRGIVNRHAATRNGRTGSGSDGAADF